MDPDTGCLLLSLLSLALGGLVVFCQNAIVGIPDNFLRHADPHTPHLAKVEKLLKSPRAFNASMRAAYTIFHLCFALFFAAYLYSLGLPLLTRQNPVVQALWIAGVVLLCSLLILIVSRGIPRRLASWMPTSAALAAAPLALVFSVAFAPIRLLVEFAVGCVVALLGADFREGEDSVTEEEIRMLVDVSEETGGIEQTEKEMINNIFEFDDRTAGEIMTHRTDLSFVEVDCTLDELIPLCMSHGFSRIPVAEDGIDNIVGILYVKDLLPMVLDAKKKRGFKVAKYMRKPLYVPGSTRCRDLFEKLNGGHTQIAVVVDEYGGTAGIVTMEDLLESIVGNIQDEYDNEIEEATAVTADSYNLDGDIDLSEVSSLMDCNLEQYIDDGYETIGGLLIGLLDRIPENGEHPTVTIDKVDFTVEDANERQILRVFAQRQNPQNQENPEQK